MIVYGRVAGVLFMIQAQCAMDTNNTDEQKYFQIKTHVGGPHAMIFERTRRQFMVVLQYTIDFETRTPNLGR